MYIEKVPNRNSPPAILLRESWREGKKTRKRTIANLSDWPDDKIEAFRRLLRGEKLVPIDEAVAIKRSLPHGHVAAVLGTIRKLGLDRVIAAKRSRERDLVVALVAERILHPGSKLASTRTWKSSTLADELGVADADVDEVYSALDWLLRRQKRIEVKLASQLLSEGGVALYDLSSSSYYGRKCSLARLGKNRDGKKGVACIAYGLLTDRGGRPVSIDVYPGNTGDPATVVDQVGKLKDRFKLSRVVLVGDRGMLTETQIENLRKYPGVGWISALRSSQIRALVDSGALQMSLFDEKNLAEISSPDHPDERLVACYNPLLADERRRTREDLLQATEESLIRIAAEVRRRTRTPLLKDEIGVKVGKVINRYKVGKHFKLTIEDDHLSWQRREDAIARESALDGIYVIRTSEPEERLPADDAVRGYKRLTLVEKAFLCLKSIDLRARPIWLRREDHVRAHLFLCMLAYYVEWHMRQALAPLLFHDEELEEARDHRDPVAPATPSASAKRKKLTRQTDDGLPLNSFSNLLTELSTLCRNDCQMKTDHDSPTFAMLTEPTPLQKRAFDLLGL
jgi:hypothetical protein